MNFYDFEKAIEECKKIMNDVSDRNDDFDWIPSVATLVDALFDGDVIEIVYFCDFLQRNAELVNREVNAFLHEAHDLSNE